MIFLVIILIIVLSLYILLFFLNEEIKQIRLRQRGPLFDFPQCELSKKIIVDGHNLRIFNNGGEVIHDMLREISGAKNYILLESYIFRHDEMGRTFRKLLVKKAKEGVRVYIIFDGIGNLVVPHDFWLRFRRAGIEVFEYGPIRSFLDYLDSKQWIREHRKTLVVDGRVAYLGGINIGREFAKRWRDTQLKIEGPIVENIKKVFIDFWNSEKKNKIAMPVNPIQDSKIQIIKSDVAKNILPIKQVYLNFINQAGKSLRLTFSYFVPDEEILAAIANASNRGVAVELILPERSDVPVVQLASNSFIERLLRFGVKVYKYKRAMIHAKTMTADGEVSIVGSANLDNRSLFRNYEIIALVTDRNFAKEMETMFSCDKINCDEIELASWVRRSRRRIFWENVFALIRNYL